MSRAGLNDGLLAGRRAIVTGAAAGIGRAVAEAFARAGAAVVVLDRDGDRARSVAGELGASAVVADVADGAALAAAFAEAAGLLGGLDVVVNNAGVGDVKALHRYADADWDRLVGVNLKGTFNGLRSAVPLLRAAGGGSIVNVASLSGLRPTRGEAPYSAAKAGVIALTASAALEYGPEIRVNCVSPGFVETPLTAGLLSRPEVRDRVEGRIPLGRVGTPVEIANVVTFLASDLASYMTGANLVVDGGSILPSAQTDDLLARYVEAVERASDG